MENAANRAASSEEVGIGFDDQDFNISPRRARKQPAEEPRHISEFLVNYLSQHETFLREMAAKEQDGGEFTPGLSRCIDMLDNFDLRPTPMEKVA